MGRSFTRSPFPRDPSRIFLFLPYSTYGGILYLIEPLNHDEVNDGRNRITGVAELQAQPNQQA